MTSTFRECYLVPKAVYNSLGRKPSKVPADVKIKQLDYEERFKNLTETKSSSPIKRVEVTKEEQVKTILESIKDDSKRNMASQIINFITSRGAGTITWTDNYTVKIDGERVFNLDIRDALRHLVGETPDPQGVTWPLYQRLRDLGAHPSLLIFYDSSLDEEDWSEEEDWDKEEEEDDDDDKEDEDKKPWEPLHSPRGRIHVSHPMTRRSYGQRPQRIKKQPTKWEAYT